METDDEILARIRVKKAAQKKSPTHNRQSRKVLRKLLEAMKADQTYSIGDIEVLTEKSGWRFDNAGNATTYGVREGYLDRVGGGQYRVTGKKMEGAYE